MTFSKVLDVAILLTGVYLALSCFCSWLNETIQAQLQSRGRYLYLGVLNLLCGERTIAAAMFSSGLVAATSKDTDGKVAARDYRPSYLEARTFSQALWQSVGQLPHPDPNAVQQTIAAPTVLFRDLSQRVGNLQGNNHLKSSLAALLNQAAGDYQKLLDVTDAWYNAQMDRVSGWYKRYSQW